MFRRGIRKRKKRLFKIISFLIPSGEAYIWRCRVSPEFKKALLGLECTVQEVEE